MAHSTIDWLVTLLAIHMIALGGIIYIFRGAPCWLQKLSVFLLGVAFMFFCFAYVCALIEIRTWWWFLVFGGTIEHGAVILYIFRIWWQGEQKKWKSSISSQNSLI